MGGWLDELTHALLTFSGDNVRVTLVYIVIVAIIALLLLIVITYGLTVLIVRGSNFLWDNRRANWPTMTCPCCRRDSEEPAQLVRVWTYPRDNWGECVMWCGHCLRRRRFRVESHEIDLLEAFRVRVTEMSRRRRLRVTIKGH